MRVSNLIDELYRIKKEYGNCDVFVDAETFSDIDDFTSSVDDVVYDKISHTIVLRNNYDPFNEYDDEKY